MHPARPPCCSGNTSAERTGQAPQAGGVLPVATKPARGYKRDSPKRSPFGGPIAMHRPQVVLRQKLLLLGGRSAAHGPGAGGPAGAVLALTCAGSVRGLTRRLGDVQEPGTRRPEPAGRPAPGRYLPPGPGPGPGPAGPRPSPWQPRRCAAGSARGTGTP